MTVHPNSLANLQSWPRGVSGNPHGRPPIGLSYQEWLNALDTHDADGVAKYDQDALEQIRDDPAQCRAKRAAAADLLDMTRTDYDKAVPLRANSIDRVSDRTVGRPIQSVMVQHVQPDDPEVLLAELRAAITRSPELLSLIGDRLPAEALPAAPEAPASQ